MMTATATERDTHVRTHAANFDGVARPYRWMEYLTFGRALERARFRLLAELAGCRTALVLGDGDGRFLARLLAQNPELHADAVDSSPVMLRLLRQRCFANTPDAEGRLTTHAVDAVSFVPTRRYDVVATHFFLDCLTQAEADKLAARIAGHLTPDALWVVSDFRIPEGGMRWPARLVVGSLYAAFRVLTGLRTSRLPDHAAALRAAGFRRIVDHISLAGLLTSELWKFSAGPAYTRGMANSFYPPAAPLHFPDPIPDPEPASPSLPEPDPNVFHPDAEPKQVPAESM